MRNTRVHVVRRTGLRRLVCCLLGTSVALAVTRCDSPARDLPAGQPRTPDDAAKTTEPSPQPQSTSPTAAHDADSAEKIAQDELRRRGIDPKSYIAATKRVDSEWVVQFLHKPPRPPGGLITIRVGAAGTIEEFRRGK